MRYLALTPDYYRILYNNVLNGPPADKHHVRTIAKILDKVEALGDPTDKGYEWNETKGNLLTLEDAEYKAIEHIQDQAKYMARFAREALKYLDWFNKAPSKPPLKVEDDSPVREETS